jgi:phosphoribosylformylglycinamidine (FGAM) synthase PurS component
MGYQGVVTDVKRERLFTIDIDWKGDPKALADGFAKELVNENKESCKIMVDTLSFENDYVPVKVNLHIEDGEAISIMNRLKARLGFTMVTDVKKANIWKLYIKSDDREAVAKQIATGLLINPNKDSYEILS